MSQSLLPYYREQVASGGLRDDPAQKLAIEKFQLLSNRLDNYDPVKPKRVGLGFFGWGRDKIEQREVPGLYIYGGVGRGKSMLMDLFFEHAPLEKKRRVHFHAFMQEVHEGIHAARKAGVEDPIGPVADKVAREAVLLCFDEMQISDITDAMLVGRLFEALFAQGVVVVTTSNRHPDDLYKNGLNRHLFLPFIELIKQRLDVFHLASDTDHRQLRLKGVETYHTPLRDGAHPALDQAWDALTGGQGEPLRLQIKGREVVVPSFRDGVGRASFADLCEKPLGPGDYLALADALRVLILDDIPLLGRDNNNEAKRFVTLIDAFYEAKVRLICSAAAEPEALYVKGAGSFEFERTASRLTEMRGALWQQEE